VGAGLTLGLCPAGLCLVINSWRLLCITLQCGISTRSGGANCMLCASALSSRTLLQHKVLAAHHQPCNHHLLTPSLPPPPHRDGLIQENDRAGFGALVARLGENGKVNKGPVTYGLRLQDRLRLGPFSVEASAAKVVSQGQMGAGKEEAWGARAFVHYDYLPGLGMILDLYQERSKSDDILNLVGCRAWLDLRGCLGLAAWGCLLGGLYAR
jgi:hypothetical protein